SLLLPSATPNIYPLSLHDALPIWDDQYRHSAFLDRCTHGDLQQSRHLRRIGHVLHIDARLPEQFLWMSLLEVAGPDLTGGDVCRSEEHTSELQSRENLVCRLLLEK